jgi:hypothetical protein
VGRLLPLTLAGLFLAVFAGGASGASREVPNLEVRAQVTTQESWPSVLILPSWQFAPGSRGADCYAAHTTLGTLMPENGQPDIDYHETRPPFPNAPIGGDWQWHCYALGGSGLKYPDPSFCTDCNYSDYFVTGEGKVAGPATVDVYLLREVQADSAYEVIDEASAFVKLPPVARSGSTSGSPSSGKPPAARPKAKPKTSSPRGKKSGKGFAFTARVSGKPVVGAERLFVSYEGSQASAEGSFLTAPTAGDSADIVDARGTISLSHRYDAFPAERYDLRLRPSASSFTKTFSNGRAVRLGLSVVSSTFSGCPAGKTGDLVVSDLTNGDGFEVDVCGLRLVWVDGRGADVRVVIRSA